MDAPLRTGASTELAGPNSECNSEIVDFEARQLQQQPGSIAGNQISTIGSNPP